MCPFHICSRAEHSIQPKPLSASTSDQRQTNGNLTYDCALSSPHFLWWNIFATSRTRQNARRQHAQFFGGRKPSYVRNNDNNQKLWLYVISRSESFVYFMIEWVPSSQPFHIESVRCASLDHLERHRTYWTGSWFTMYNKLDEGKKYLGFSIIADGSC